MDLNDITTEALNPLGLKFYAVDAATDYYILADNLLNLQTNQSIRFNKQTIPTGSSTVNFTDRAGQVAFADADYMLKVECRDSAGLLAPIKVPDSGYTASGFSVNNEQGISLELQYIAIKL